jgi:hypothetical protein
MAKQIWFFIGAVCVAAVEIAMGVLISRQVALYSLFIAIPLGLFAYWKVFTPKISLKKGGNKMLVVLGALIMVGGLFGGGFLIIHQLNINTVAKQMLSVEKVVPLVNRGWGLKVTNNSTQSADDCLGVLAIVEAVDLTTPSADTLNDTFGNHALHWDSNSIQPGGSSVLYIAYALYPFNSPQKGIYKLAWENEPQLAKAFFAYSMMILISITSKDNPPIYTLCYFNWKDIDDFGDLEIVSNNLVTKPSIVECRQMLTDYIAKH